MYIDHNFYQIDYGGSKVGIEDFNRLEYKARNILNYYTFNRVRDLVLITDDIKFTICELMDNLYMEEKESEEKEIQSEGVGTYSVTYAVSKKGSSNKKQKEIIYRNLAHTNLLYRGGAYVF